MSEGESRKSYDLEERTFAFAQRVRRFVKLLPRTIGNIEDVRLLIRSSGSVGANYIEANESLGRKDFKFRIRIARKEAKESRYWLRLLDTGQTPVTEEERVNLVQESTELMMILAAILRKTD
jgi:four helix bundle protein